MVLVAHFDGTDDYASAPDSTSLRTPTTALTMAGWVYRHSNGQTWGTVATKSMTSGEPYSSYAIFRYSSTAYNLMGQASATGQGGGIGQTGQSTSVPTGSWKFVVLTKTATSGVQVRLRIFNEDGTLFSDTTNASAGAYSIGYGALPFYLGGYPGEVSGFRIARWGVHNTVLSDTDLATWRTTGTPPVTCSAAFWPLNGVWTDSAQGNTLTANNGATFVDVTVPWTEPTGSTPTTSTAGGTYSFTGSATGKRTPKSSATGAYVFTGAAVGSTLRKSTAAGTYVFTGSAVGSAPVVGAKSSTASGSWVYSGSATGKRAPKATASGSWTFTGAATGTTQRRSTASGAWSFAGSAIGSTPVVGGKSSTATGTWSFTGAAVGRTLPKSTAVGSYAFAGAAVGSTTRTSTASGTWSYVGSATGSAGSPPVGKQAKVFLVMRGGLAIPIG